MSDDVVSPLASRTVAPPSTGGPGSALPRPRPPRTAAGELRQWFTVLSSQASHYFRTNRFLGLFGFVVLISCLTLAFQFQVGIPAERAIQLGRSAEYLGNFLMLTPLWVILSAAFFAGDALSTDFSSGTGYYMLVQPVHRRTILAGRYASAAVATLAIVLVYFAFAIFGAAYFFGIGTIPWAKVGVAFELASLYTLACLSVAFCISAFVRSPAAGVLVSVLALYVGFASIQSTVELANYEPWWSLLYAGNAITVALDTDFVHRTATPLGSGQVSSVFNAGRVEGMLIMLAYLAVFLGLTLYLYSRKESTPSSSVEPVLPPAAAGLATAPPRPARRRVSSLRQGWVVFTSQASHYLRTRRFLALLGFVVVVSLLTLAFEFQVGIPAERAIQLGRVSEYLANFIVLLPLFIVLAAAFFAGDALSTDFSSGTGYYMLVQPVHRRTILAGRYASAAVATLAIVLVYFAFAIFGAAYFFGIGTIPWAKVVVGLELSAVFTLAALSVAFCISAFVRSPAAGVLVTVLALYVGFTTLQSVVELANYEPWWSLLYAGNTMAEAFDTDYVRETSAPLGSGQYTSVWMAGRVEGMVISVIYLAIFLVLSLYLYSRKESGG